MKPLVIYHKNCADGFGAAFAAWLKLGDEAEYRAEQYGTDYSKSENTFEFEGREVYILDFSFPRGIMEMLFEKAKRVVWLDHHKTAWESWYGQSAADGYGGRVEDGPNYHIKLDFQKSGAYLAWEYFHPGIEVPMLIKHIDDYDRWQFKIEGTKAFNKALWSYAPWSFIDWNTRYMDAADGSDMREDTHKQLIAEGAAILRAHDQNVQSVVKGAARSCGIVPAIINSVDSYNAPWGWWHDDEHGDTCGVNGLAANCPPHLTSDAGHELANQSGTFGLCWTLGKEGMKANCSLRSNGDYDVSAIAKVFGGGGHKNAAGFEIDIQTLLGWLK